MERKCLDGTNCRIVLDTGASKSFMSKRFYLNYQSLHSLPKFALKVVTYIHGHKFEIYFNDMIYMV